MRFDDMSKHIYVRGDGNGGINMSKLVAAILTLVALITPFVAMSVYAATMNAKLENLQKEWDSVGPRHTAIIEGMKQTDQQAEEKIIVLETKLERIQTDVSEIKGDVKELVKQKNGG